MAPDLLCLEVFVFCAVSWLFDVLDVFLNRGWMVLFGLPSGLNAAAVDGITKRSIPEIQLMFSEVLVWKASISIGSNYQNIPRPPYMVVWPQSSVSGSAPISTFSSTALFLFFLFFLFLFFSPPVCSSVTP